MLCAFIQFDDGSAELFRARSIGTPKPQPGRVPLAIGRDGSLTQADHEPGYMAASIPIAASASTVCAADMPAPQ